MRISKLFSHLPKLKPIRYVIILGAIVGLTYFLTIKVIGQIQVRSGQIVYGFIGQPNRINPLWSDLNPIDAMLVNLFYEPLIKFDTSGQPQPALAESWEVSEDQKEYTIHLKPDITWEDNEPFTANDVIFTYLLTTDQDYNGPESNRFQGIEMEVIDNNTMKFKVKNKFSPFLETLSLPILPQHIWENMDMAQMRIAKQNLKPIGIAQYHVDDIQARLTEKKIDTMFVQNRTHNQKVVFKFYEDEETLLTAYDVGDIDYFVTDNELLTKKYDRWSNTGQAQIPVCGETLTIFSNMTKEKGHPVLNTSFKEAVYLALNKEESPVKVRLSPYADSHWVSYKGGPIEKTNEEIRSILEAVDRDYDLNIQSVVTQPGLTIAQDIVTQLQQYGLTLNLETHTVDELINDIIPNRKYDFILIHQKFSADPDQFEFWHSTQADIANGGLNISGYNNRQTDKALEDGRKTISQDDRKQYYEIFQKKLMSDLPALFVEYTPVIELSRNKSNLATTANSCIWHTSDYLSTALQFE